jgi:hypothetical protein
MTVGGRHIDATTAALALATALVLGVLLAALLMRAAASRNQAERGTAGAPGSILQAPETVGAGTSAGTSAGGGSGSGVDSGSDQQQPARAAEDTGGGQVSPPAYGGSDESVTSSPNPSQTDDRSSSTDRYEERGTADRDRRDESKDEEKADKEREREKEKQDREEEKREREQEREREKRDREEEKREREQEREREKRDREEEKRQ